MLYQRLKFRVRCLFRRSQVERELEDEIRAHLAIAEQERLDRGEALGDAKRNALRELGNELLIKETTRDMWAWASLERLAKDMKYILRQIKRSPVFTATAVLTLALGLGGTTAIFSIVNGVLLQPLRFRDPGRIYLARTLPPARSKLTGEFPVNARHFQEWRTHCRSCEAISLVRYDEITLSGAGDPVQLPTYTVSFDFFRTLGAQPSLGRDFLPEEELPGHFAVILTDALWRSRFGADPSIVGRTIQINGEANTVAGVMPPQLHLPKGDEWGPFFGPQKAPLIFRPLGIDVSRVRPAGNMNYTAVVRLRPGVGRERGMAELNALLADFARADKLQTTTTLIPLSYQVIRNARAALWLLLGAVGAVLLIACVNIGNLMLVRTTGRYREAGVRMALGACRRQLFGLVLKESLVLVAIGGGLGLLLATVGLRWLAASAPISLPRIEEVQIDWRVLSFSALAAGFSTIACGLLPAWRLSRIEPLASIKAGSGGSTESSSGVRLRDALVGVEVALSTVLLIIGGLLMLSFWRVMRVEKGFEVAHLITQDVAFLSPKYRKEGARTRFLDEVLRKLARVPGAESVGAINQLPLIGEDWVGELEDPEQPAHPVENAALANFRFVNPDYWKAMGIPLKQGRLLDESDRNRPKAVISERAAQYLWPNRNPLGKHVVGVGQKAPSLEVVGVVGEVRAAGLEQTNATMMVYEHYWRMKPTGMSIVVRTRNQPAPVMAAIRAIVSSADPEMAISQAKTMEQILDESVAPRKFQMNLAVGFAITALVLASLGIYGVISFAVARRTPEIGIRIALGARGMQLVAMVMRQGMMPVFAGIVTGLAGALMIGRFLASQLFGVSPHDPATMVTVVVVLLAVAICACWAPARRATRIDPIRALRFE